MQLHAVMVEKEASDYCTVNTFYALLPYGADD